MAAAKDLRLGLRCLNGLTDGWALLLDSIERVQTAHVDELDPDEQDLLRRLREAVESAVYRR